MDREEKEKMSAIEKEDLLKSIMMTSLDRLIKILAKVKGKVTIRWWQQREILSNTVLDRIDFYFTPSKSKWKVLSEDVFIEIVCKSLTIQQQQQQWGEGEREMLETRNWERLKVTNDVTTEQT